jgi:hypothetical protein
MGEPQFKLRFPPSEIPHWASRYAYAGEDRTVDTVGRSVQSRGYLKRQEFLRLCRWKTPRSQPRCARNPASLVREATEIALATDDERAKMYVLRSLAGVEWPTASVILHFCDRRPYPILDYRALWSLGYRKPPAYTFAFWMAYTRFTRELSQATGHSMRTVDKALWRYSKEHQ